MFIKTLKESLPYLSEANIPAMVWGNHGIGKSQSVKQFAEESGYHFVDIRLGTLEVGDFLGLSDFEKDVNGQSVATKFITPDWLKEVLAYCKTNPQSKAIIFLDEFNRARRDVLQASFQLVLDKRFHTHILPTNCYVVAACNPNTEDYIVTDIADKALMDRFCHIKLNPSVDEWIDHAVKREFTADIIDFIRDQRQLLQAEQQDFSLEDVKPSRRSWEMVNRLIKAQTPQNILQELCYGLVGHAATVAFINHLKTADKPFTAKDILKNYSKIKDKVKSFATVDADSKSTGRLDILSSSTDNLRDHLEKLKTSEGKLTDKEGENMMEYINDLPTEQAFDVARRFYLYDFCRPFFDKDKELFKKLNEAKQAIQKVAKKKAE